MCSTMRSGACSLKFTPKAEMNTMCCTPAALAHSTTGRSKATASGSREGAMRIRPPRLPEQDRWSRDRGSQAEWTSRRGLAFPGLRTACRTATPASTNTLTSARPRTPDAPVIRMGWFIISPSSPTLSVRHGVDHVIHGHADAQRGIAFGILGASAHSQESPVSLLNQMATTSRPLSSYMPRQ